MKWYLGQMTVSWSRQMGGSLNVRCLAMVSDFRAYFYYTNTYIKQPSFFVCLLFFYSCSVWYFCLCIFIVASLCYMWCSKSHSSDTQERRMECNNHHSKHNGVMHSIVNERSVVVIRHKFFFFVFAFVRPNM